MVVRTIEGTEILAIIQSKGLAVLMDDVSGQKIGDLSLADEGCGF